MDGKGTLACVGVGMTLGAHFAPRARDNVETADVVFVAVSDPVVERWVQRMHRDVRSLQPHYREGRSRHETYAEMVATILAEVRNGCAVCCVFYGHPGVFATVAHRAIAMAQNEGCAAWMEPGISAADCLYADLGIDPGATGCQHYEASQFMFYRRTLDTAAWLILWQVGVAGVRDTGRFRNTAPEREMLVEKLARDYPLSHVVVLYEAATLPHRPPRIERIPLSGLVDAALDQQTTLAVPPGKTLERDAEMLRRLARTDDAGEVVRTC